MGTTCAASDRFVCTGYPPFVRPVINRRRPFCDVAYADRCSILNINLSYLLSSRIQHQQVIRREFWEDIDPKCTNIAGHPYRVLDMLSEFKAWSGLVDNFGRVSSLADIKAVLLVLYGMNIYVKY